MKIDLCLCLSATRWSLQVAWRLENSKWVRTLTVQHEGKHFVEFAFFK
jgi:hypothetical protein